MYVCLCNAVTDEEIRSAAESGARSVRDLRRHLGVASQCGSCACLARDILAEAKDAAGAFGPAGALPAGAFLKPEG